MSHRYIYGIVALNRTADRAAPGIQIQCARSNRTVDGVDVIKRTGLQSHCASAKIGCCIQRQCCCVVVFTDHNGAGRTTNNVGNLCGGQVKGTSGAAKRHGGTGVHRPER